MICIYNIADRYLYEILDDYQCEDEKGQEMIFRAFSKALWGSNNKRKISKRTIKYKVDNRMLNTPEGQLFDNYSSIYYLVGKTKTQEKDYISLLRQKINNLYNSYCEPQLFSSMEYVSLLRTPINLYYSWLKNPEAYTYDFLKQEITSAISQAELMHEKNTKEKMNISWVEYKHLINSFLKRIFDNYIAFDRYSTSTDFLFDTDFWDEDHYIVSYINKSLSGYMANYQKAYYNITRNSNKKYGRCSCGNMFVQNAQNNKKLCDECKRKNTLKKYIKYNNKRVSMQKPPS